MKITYSGSVLEQILEAHRFRPNDSVLVTREEFNEVFYEAMEGNYSKLYAEWDGEEQPLNTWVKVNGILFEVEE